MKTNLYTKRIQIPIYRQTFDVLIGDRQEAREYIKNGCGFDMGDKVPDGTVVSDDESGHCYLWLPDETHSMMISHECFHLTHSTLDRAGLFLSHQSEEAYAYLLQWFIEQVYDCYKDYDNKYEEEKKKK